MTATAGVQGAASVEMPLSYSPMELLTVDEVAALLRVKKSWVYAAFERGDLPGVKLSHKQLRFRPADVQGFVDGLSR